MRYIVGEALLNVRHGGIVSVLAVFIVALTTILFGAFSLIRNVVRGEVARFEENPAVVAFVKDEVSEDRFAQLAETLSGLPDVQNAVKVSKNEALNRSRRIFADASSVLLDGLQEHNPLPRSIEVYPIPSARRSKSLEALVLHLRSLDEFEGVVYEAEGIRMTERVKDAAFLFGALVALISVVVISFSIMLTIYARRDELAILQLVGATNAFVRVPLILQGCFEGFIGSEIGMGVFYLLFRRFGSSIGLNTFLSAEQALYSIAGATAIGLVGGLIPLRSRLRHVG